MLPRQQQHLHHGLQRAGRDEQLQLFLLLLLLALLQSLVV
jgi:hypothetical protein